MILLEPRMHVGSPTVPPSVLSMPVMPVSILVRSVSPTLTSNFRPPGIRRHLCRSNPPRPVYNVVLFAQHRNAMLPWKFDNFHNLQTFQNWKLCSFHLNSFHRNLEMLRPYMEILHISNGFGITL